MATPSEQLEAMRLLNENWDGYGAAAPQSKAIDLAQDFIGLLELLRKASAPGEKALYVSPTRTGGVQIEWEDPCKEHEIEINPDGSIEFLHYEKSTGQVETKTFTPEGLAVIQTGVLRELMNSMTHSAAA